MTTETLEELNVVVLDDFIKYMPNVSASSRGPGEAIIYMRGLSIGALGTQGQASVGGWPNVAVYLDDQAAQVPGRNLDVFAADMARLEVLEGPQGTLFGAGAQAGVLRFITNKPEIDTTEIKFSGSYGTTAHGNDNGSLEAVINLPLVKEKLALRAVIYNDERGGYIDNVESTFTRRSTDAGFALRNGGVVPTDSVVINNFNIADDDINDVTYKGIRVGLKWNVNDDWDVLLTQSFQEMNSSGVFFQHPNGAENQPLNDLEVTLFNPSEITDEFTNTALTVNGRLGMLDLVYTGGFLKRESDQAADYTNYARGVWAAYYQCTGYGDVGNKCFSPSATWQDETENRNQSHEFRLSTPDDQRLRVIGGVFWEKRELDDDTAWQYKTIPECELGGPDACFHFLDPTQAPGFASSTLNNGERRNSAVGFIDDFQRNFEQIAVFASVDFDITDNLTATVGTRWFEIENEKVGSNFGSFGCKVFSGGAEASGPCLTPGGTNLDEQNPHSNKDDDFKSRANLSWNINDDIMVYAAWSEGYRTGGFNRGPGSGALFDTEVVDDAGLPVSQWSVPLEYATDDLQNFEAGWKTLLFDGRLQFNGAVYLEQWDNVQVGIFAPQLGLGNLTLSMNGPEYEVKGIEASIIMRLTDKLTLTGAYSFNDSELTNSPRLVNNNPDHPNFGQDITTALFAQNSDKSDPLQTVSVENVFGEKGDVLANSPRNQANLRARYEFEFNDFEAFWQIGAAFQSSSVNEATKSTENRFIMPEWTVVDASIGVARDQWRLELHAQNLLDENKSLFTTRRMFIRTENPMRPRTINLRFSYAFRDD